MSERDYVMVMRNDRFWLVGPFDTQRQAAAWGRDPAHNPDDDPRWQTITLEEGQLTRPPTLVTPLASWMDAARPSAEYRPPTVEALRDDPCPVRMFGYRDGRYLFSRPKYEAGGILPVSATSPISGGPLVRLFGQNVGWLWRHFPVTRDFTLADGTTTREVVGFNPVHAGTWLRAQCRHLPEQEASTEAASSLRDHNTTPPAPGISRTDEQADAGQAAAAAVRQAASDPHE